MRMTRRSPLWWCSCANGTPSAPHTLFPAQTHRGARRLERQKLELRGRLEHVTYLNALRAQKRPLYGASLHRLVRPSAPLP